MPSFLWAGASPFLLSRSWSHIGPFGSCCTLKACNTGVQLGFLSSGCVVIVGVPAVDYLRLGSFNEGSIAAFHAEVLGRENVDEGAFWRQYRGIRAGQVFAGVAEQNGAIHGLLDASGVDAHSLLVPEFEDVRCTRIDFQLTLELGGSYRARDFKDALEAADWSDGAGSRLHRRRVEMIEGPSAEGLDTVYIGSRSSDRFARVYVKDDGDGGRFLRFEVEFKGDRADRAYGLAVAGGASVAGILLAEWERVPSVDVRAWLQFGEVLRSWVAGSVEVSVPRSAGDSDSRYRWFVSTVVPFLESMLNDHSNSRKTAAVLRDLLARSE